MDAQKKAYIAQLIIVRKIKRTLSEPNSPESIKIAKNYATKTGISYMELHRFHNAVLNNNLSNSFTHERVDEISLTLCKEVLRYEGKIPNQKLRGEMSEFANEFGISFNELLEFMRELYIEIVNEVLQPQSKA